jgi:hypothetical protein
VRRRPGEEYRELPRSGNSLRLACTGFALLLRKRGKTLLRAPALIPIRKHMAIKLPSLFAVAFLAVQLAQAGNSHPAQDDAMLREEFAQQQKIYEITDESLLASYVVDRSLQNYVRALSPDFDRALASLGPQDRWLDIGAGMGFAVLDYYNPNYDLLHPEGKTRRGRKAQAVAISIENRRHLGWQVTAARLAPGQIRYLSGRRLREYTTAELGRFQLITDVYGGFSYTTDLSRFMENVLDFLVLQGSFYSVLQDVRAEDGSNAPFSPDSSFMTEIAKADGSQTGVCQWLKSIGCAQATCEFRNWRPSVEVYSVRKVCNEVMVPRLEPTFYKAGMPPARQFQHKK